jgi:uncharacterized membrane protein
LLTLAMLACDLEGQSPSYHRGAGSDDAHFTAYSHPSVLQDQGATSGHLVTGALIGAVVGAAGGAFLYGLQPDFCDPADDSPYSTCESSGPSLATTMLVGAAGGALVGGLIGTMVRSRATLTIVPAIGHPRAGPKMGFVVRLPM